MKRGIIEYNTGIWDVLLKNIGPERIAAGFAFTEGPVWKDGSLLFNDIPNDRTVRYRALAEGPEITTFRHPSGAANGQALAADGTLIVCEQNTRCISAIDPGGRRVLADSYNGMRLNSPNDVALHPNGKIYFTDPPFGLPEFGASRELPFNGVFRVCARGEVVLLDDELAAPNGLTFSPNGETLYVDDTEKLLIYAYDIDEDGDARRKRQLCDMSEVKEPGGPDGMTVDTEGRLYCTGPGGIWIFEPDGARLGRIVLPELPSNMAWGGPRRDELYITAVSGLYRLRTKACGAF